MVAWEALKEGRPDLPQKKEQVWKHRFAMGFAIWEKQFRWHCTVNEGTPLLLCNALVCAEIRLTSLWRSPAKQQPLAVLLMKKIWLHWAPCRPCVGCKPSQGYSGLPAALGFRGINKKEIQTALHNATKGLLWQSSRAELIPSAGRRNSCSTVCAVLILQKQGIFAYYSLVLFHVTSLCLSYKQNTSAKHNEEGGECNARPGPIMDSALTVLPTGVTNQHLSTPLFRKKVPFMPLIHMAVTAAIVLPLYVKTGYAICVSTFLRNGPGSLILPSPRSVIWIWKVTSYETTFKPEALVLRFFRNQQVLFSLDTWIKPQGYGHFSSSGFTIHTLFCKGRDALLHQQNTHISCAFIAPKSLSYGSQKTKPRSIQLRLPKFNLLHLQCNKDLNRTTGTPNGGKRGKKKKMQLL